MNRKSFHELLPLLSGRTLTEGFRQFLDSTARLLSKVRNSRHFPRIVRASCVALPLLAVCLLCSSSPQYRPGPYGMYARLPVNRTVLDAVDLPMGVDTYFPAPDGNRFNPLAAVALPATPFISGAGPLVRGEVRLDAGAVPFHEYFADEGVRQQRGLIHFSRGRVSIQTIDGAVPVALLRQASVPVPAKSADIFQVNLFVPRNVKNPDLPPLLYGEATNDEGVPVRWGNAPRSPDGILICGAERPNSPDLIRRLLHGLGLISTEAQFSAGAGKYQPFVRRYAEKYGLAASLVLAIMHTESGFNPYAVSQSQAVGLMQIVPYTAGNEVYRYLMGTQGTPSLETLFSPEDNISYGTAYLHLLGRRYFGGVRDSASRQMCMIAAYNGGPNAVLRLFDSDPGLAVSRINDLSPTQVYTALTTEMPNMETRRYVELVLGRMQNYSVN